MCRCVEHEFLTYIEKDQQFYSYPIHEDDVAIMPEPKIIAQELASTKAKQSPAPKTLEEYWVIAIKPHLYHKFIASYSKKCGRYVTIMKLMISVGHRRELV